MADITTDGCTVLRGVVPGAALEDLRARIEEAVAQMFFLDDVDAGNGPPRLVPGTHRSHSVPPKSLATDPRSQHPDQVSAMGSAGDVLVLSSHLWHSGTANESGRPRRVITVTYRRG
jgi:ectoine hydroxylase-related dioxygenase (phytanoyl-CoA dioxygenase family)